jgi:hypothetical protein
VGVAMSSPVRQDRTIRIFFALVATGLGLSVLIPFTVVAIREGSVAAGLQWVWVQSGIIGALVGCALVSTVIGKRHSRGGR